MRTRTTTYTYAVQELGAELDDGVWTVADSQFRTTQNRDLARALAAWVDAFIPEEQRGAIVLRVDLAVTAPARTLPKY